MSANDIINKLGLIPHVEGGYFKETYASDVETNGNSIATSIYFLMEKDNFSAFHRLTSDEMWFFHSGSPLTISMIDPDGRYHEVKLGLDFSQGQRPFFTVPKTWIFGSFVEDGYALVSCVVAPGFTYDDFELFERDNLLEEYPEHADIIERLTRK